MAKFRLFFFVIFILLFGGSFIVWMQLPKIISFMIAKQTKTHVRLGSITFHSNGFSLNDLVIESPVGGTIRKALSVGSLRIDASYDAYSKRPLIIEGVKLDDIFLGIEFFDENNTQGNWVTIMHNLDDSTQEGAVDAPPDDYALIKELKLESVNIDLKLYKQKKIRLKTIPTISFEDVRTDTGQIADELTEIIIEKVMYTVFIKKGIQTVINIPKDVIKTVISPFSWFTGGG